MKNLRYFLVLLILLAALILASCSNMPRVVIAPMASATPAAALPPITVEMPTVIPPPPTFVPQASPTPDPCSKERIGEAILSVHDLIREFDQVLFLAQNAPQAQLISPLMKMQEIRRQAEIQDVPACLAALRAGRDRYMGATLFYMAHFMSGAIGEGLEKEIGQAAAFQKEYKDELTRLLSEYQLAPMAEIATPQAESAPPTDGFITQTPQAPAAESSPEAQLTPGATVEAGIFAVNPSKSDALMLLKEPKAEAEVLGLLPAGERTLAQAKSADGAWLLLALPNTANQSGWVETARVQLMGDLNSLPVK